MEYVGFSVLWWVAVFMPTFAQERNAVGESVTVDPSGRFGTPPQWSTVEHYVHNWVQQVIFYSQGTFRVLLPATLLRAHFYTGAMVRMTSLP